MIANEIIEAIGAKPLMVSKKELLEKDYKSAFASDLMSDVLAMVQEEAESTVLITGLCNAQAIRTAEMLDIQTIIFVRGKAIGDDVLDLAEDSGLNIFSTYHTMYETCGILFTKGLKGIDGHYSA